jgi:antitoxin (DNA-binding transcriptional repressor) of toxin-antitoxin stability system
MKRYTMTEARQQFAELLDAAERGRPVVIERRGVRFIVAAQRRRRRRSTARQSIIQSVDPAVASGEWTWDWRADGLRFRHKRRTR